MSGTIEKLVRRDDETSAQTQKSPFHVHDICSDATVDAASFLEDAYTANLENLTSESGSSCN